MRNTFRLMLAVLLAAAMLLQCFAAGAVFLDEPEPTEPPAETAEPIETVVPEETPEPVPETDAPIVSEAQVCRADEGTAVPLISGMTLSYQTAIFHFVFSDPAGESGAEPSGIDLDACTLHVDGRRISDVLADNAETSLTASMTLGYGRHALRIVVRDHDGNKTEVEYIVNVNVTYTDLPVYTVSSDLEYAPLGGRVSVLIHTSDASNLLALNVAMQISRLDDNGFEIEAGSGFSLDEGSVHYDAASGVLQFRVRANLKLLGARDVASVSFQIPTDQEQGSTFRYEIPGAWAETRSSELLNYCEGFFLAARSLLVEAPYTLTVEDLFVGMEGAPYFRVTDHAGNMVQSAQVFDADRGFLGLTNWQGQFPVPSSMLAASGTYVLYASKDLGRSFPVAVTVADTAQDLESSLTFRAQANPDGSKTVSWISSIHDQVYLRWAASPQALSSAVPVPVSTSRVLFGNQMAQINTCTISNLQPGSVGYLQVSYDQKEWSVMEPFSACDFSDGTRFSVIGSIASAEQQDLQSLLGFLAESDSQMTVQLGDAVSDSESAEAWNETVSALDVLGGTDFLMVPGEDTAGRTAAAVAVQPEAPYSYEYGSVYFAVIPGAVNSAALNWLAGDAAQSKCLWKVLLTASPVAESDRALIEQAEIHVVVSGGAYSRTPALSGGEIARSYDDAARTSLRGDGVVYFSCGNPAEEMVCLTAEATNTVLKICAWDAAEGEARELDSFTMLASSCSTDGHSLSEQTVDDPVEGTIACDLCGQKIPVAKSGYTGFASMNDGRVYLERGVIRTGWFYAAGTLMHAGADARVHQTMDFSTETCTEDGARMAWCSECRITRSYGTTVPACGHHYDDAHHCTNIHFDAMHKSFVCGWTGVSIESLNTELEYHYGYYSGEALEPAVTVKTADGELIDSKDYTISYEHNTEIGMAAVRIIGVNGCYGERVLPFEIRPCDVESVQVSEVGQTQLTLSWEAAPGAQRYAVYQQTNSGWKRLGDTTELTYSVTGLSPAVLYTFRVRPFAAAEFSGKRLDGSLDRTFWAAHHSESVSVRTEGIRFIDVPAGEWFAAPVQWAVDQNITNGTDLNLFSPENDCTRGQMVTFLWRAKGCPEPTMRSSPFSDVNDPAEYYYKAVLWAVEQGITRGSSQTTFSPDAPVTRGMVVTFLHRAAGSAAPQSSVSPFVDVASDQYYAQSVQWAVEQKITNGMDDTHFAPDLICTRAQIVTFLYRFMNN